MRPLIILLVMGIAYGGAAYGQTSAAAGRAYGSPGSATPQPFVSPVPRNPAQRPDNPSWLKRGEQGPREGNLAPRDNDLPLLEQQRQRNQQKPEIRKYD